MFGSRVMRWLTSWSKKRALKEICKSQVSIGTNLEGRIRTGCFSGNTLKDIVDEAVEDGHSLVGDTGIRVDLLEDFESSSVDVQCKNRKENTPL